MKQITKRTDSSVLILKTLPSRFVGYDVNFLQCRALNLGEIKYLQTTDLPDELIIETYNQVLLNFDIYDLSVVDFMYFAIYAILFTNPGQAWSWTVLCKNLKCAKVFDHRLHAKNFAKFYDMKAEALPASVEINDKILEFGLFTVRDRLEISKEEYKKGYEIELLNLAFTLKNYPIKEAYEILYKINNPDDFDVLAYIESQLDHDVEPYDIKCPHCDHSDSYALELEVSNLRPFRKSDEPLKRRISFGKGLEFKTVSRSNEDVST